jgi:hypothetical protein
MGENDPGSTYKWYPIVATVLFKFVATSVQGIKKSKADREIRQRADGEEEKPVER